MNDYWSRRTMSRRTALRGAAIAGTGAVALGVLGCNSNSDSKKSAPAAKNTTLDPTKGKPGGTMIIQAFGDPGGGIQLVVRNNAGVAQFAGFTHSGMLELLDGTPVVPGDDVVSVGPDRDPVGSRSSYDVIAERVFSSLDADAFLIEYTEIEYTEPRAGSFESLRFVPKGKTVVIGIMSVRDKNLESVDYLRRRIEEAAKYVPLENLAISPQCGFSGANNTPWMSWEEQRQKLERLGETARKVWA